MNEEEVKRLIIEVFKPVHKILGEATGVLEAMLLRGEG